MSNVEIDQIRPTSRSEYYRMFEAGIFDGERVELLRGLVVTMSPHSNTHANTVVRLTELLIMALHGRAEVRPQVPLAASNYSEPEPDLAVTRRRDPHAEHPTTAFLVIEVSLTSLRKDIQVKTSIYAEAGVEAYWIVDLKNDRVLVYADPVDGLYTSEFEAIHGDSLVVPGFQDVVLTVHQILPR